MFNELLSEGGLSLDRLKNFCAMAEAGGIARVAGGDPACHRAVTRKGRTQFAGMGRKKVRFHAHVNTYRRRSELVWHPWLCFHPPQSDSVQRAYEIGRVETGGKVKPPKEWSALITLTVRALELHERFGLLDLVWGFLAKLLLRGSNKSSLVDFTLGLLWSTNSNVTRSKLGRVSVLAETNVN
jgi:hypothetical protein